ncbi:ankyrin, partial [Aspergillus sclerotiicarbonarius CBS 121057]
LIKAVENEHEEIFKLLLEANISVDVSSVTGDTALHKAAETGNFHIAKLLVAHGGERNAINNFGMTPAQLAVKGGHLAAFQATAIHLAADSGDTTILRTLLDTDHSLLNNRNKKGKPALAMAALRGYVGAVDILLQFQADTEISDNNGATPLSLAQGRNHVDVAKVLLQNGANVEARSSYGANPLNRASARGQLRFVKLLLEHNVDIEASDTTGFNALLSAARSGHSNIVEILLKIGANIQATEKQGWTALGLASLEGHLEVVARLVQH